MMMITTEHEAGKNPVVMNWLQSTGYHFQLTPSANLYYEHNELFSPYQQQHARSKKSPQRCMQILVSIGEPQLGDTG